VGSFDSLLQVVAEFKRHEKADLYRRAAPLDAGGQNVFRACLVRLQAYADRNPDRDADIVLYIRGEALARLGEFEGAVDTFRQLTEIPESPLAPKARERLNVMPQIEFAARRSSLADSLADLLADLERRRDALAQLEKQDLQPVDRALVQREREQVERETALFLFRNRYVLEKGGNRALDFARDMVSAHPESRLRFAHRLTLGEFYLEMAKDMALLEPPDRLGFDETVFRGLLERARAEFALVSQADGFEEKLEGVVKAEELEAFERRVERMLR
jgi:tetratricopeptide (TPR) repeat protein